MRCCAGWMRNSSQRHPNDQVDVPMALGQLEWDADGLEVAILEQI